MARSKDAKFAKIEPMTAEKPQGVAPRKKRIDHCPVCSSSDTKYYFSAPDRLHGVPGEFIYCICNSCQSVFQNPMVIAEDLHLCYPLEYLPYNVRREIPEIDFDRLPNGNFLGAVRKGVVESVKGKDQGGISGILVSLLAKFAFVRERAFYGLVLDDCLPKGKDDIYALDLGCGSGWYMQKLAKVGWQTDGLEWDETAAKLARETTGSNVWSGDFFDIDLPRNKYQLIVLNHVFEHFAEPGQVLARVSELLTPGGRVVLFYPNPHALGAAWYKALWFAWEVPRHLVLPTPASLKKLAKQSGFRKTKITSRAYYPEELWVSSAAFAKDLNPDKERPPLALAEKLGVLSERVSARLGFETGWEVVAVLTK